MPFPAPSSERLNLDDRFPSLGPPPIFEQVLLMEGRPFEHEPESAGRKAAGKHGRIANGDEGFVVPVERVEMRGL